MLHSLAWVCQLWRPAKLLSPQFVFLSIGVDISVHVRRRKFWFPGLQHCHVVSHNQDTQPLPEVAWDLQVIYFLRNGLRDIKSNCMPKIRVIGWFWNLALFWQLISCHKLSNCHKKSFDPRNRLRDMKSNCMPKITLIGWIWNFALFWQLISSYVLSSCPKKVLTQKNDLGIANLIVCQKSVWLVEFEICPILTAYQLLRAVKLS